MSLYSKPSARVYASGILSDSFNLTNGTRQGCPLSPIVFSLAIEPLAELIRNTAEIKGLQVGLKEHKIGLFADDIILTLTNPENSLPRAAELLHNFGEITYYKLNTSKCYTSKYN